MLAGGVSWVLDFKAEWRRWHSALLQQQCLVGRNLPVQDIYGFSILTFLMSNSVTILQDVCASEWQWCRSRWECWHLPDRPVSLCLLLSERDPRAPLVSERISGSRGRSPRNPRLAAFPISIDIALVRRHRHRHILLFLIMTNGHWPSSMYMITTRQVSQKDLSDSGISFYGIPELFTTSFSYCSLSLTHPQIATRSSMQLILGQSFTPLVHLHLGRHCKL